MHHGEWVCGYLCLYLIKGTTCVVCCRCSVGGCTGSCSWNGQLQVIGVLSLTAYPMLEVCSHWLAQVTTGEIR